MLAAHSLKRMVFKFLNRRNAQKEAYVNAIEEKMIRRLVLEGKSSEIRTLLLCRSQRQLVEKIRESGEITAKQISDAYSISIQNASMKLNALHKKGYLARDIEAHESGGIEYVYMVRDFSVLMLSPQ